MFGAANYIDLAAAANAGLPLAPVRRLTKTARLNLIKLARISPSDLKAREHSGRLTPKQSDRLLRFVIIWEAALDLFEGDADGARCWLEAPQHAFGDRTPIQVAQSEVGAREVEDLITRLQHGVFS